MIWRLSGKPSAPMSSNLEVPPASRFISKPKKKKLGTKPYQKRFSRVANNIPLPASAKPSSHFLQFINIIIAHRYIGLRAFLSLGLFIVKNTTFKNITNYFLSRLTALQLIFTTFHPVLGIKRMPRTGK